MTHAHTQKRDFFLNQDVEASSIKDIILGIIEINKIDDEASSNAIKYERKPIKITVDSFGGEIYSGMALVNLIDVSKTPVHTYCYGKAMSMGLAIFIVGHKRFAHPLCTFMHHQLSGGARGTLMEMVESIEEKKRLNEMLEDLIVSKSFIKKPKLEQLKSTKTDWFFTGQEAIKLGVADELITRQV